MSLRQEEEQKLLNLLQQYLKLIEMTSFATFQVMSRLLLLLCLELKTVVLRYSFDLARCILMTELNMTAVFAVDVVVALRLV